MDEPLELSVNGRPVRCRVPAERLLVALLREDLGLTGTHQGCDTAQCGACTVMVDGQAVKSCNVLALQVDGSEITTIEGVSGDAEALHVMQLAFSRHHGLQCGYCTPGMVMRALAMVRENVPAEPHAVREALAGNLCRCTGYEGIVAAIIDGMQQLRGAGRGEVHVEVHGEVYGEAHGKTTGQTS
jgi:carbon-monoxide dehydrogenase small subunit